MTTLQFYIERAADCRRDADQSTLENVRLRNLNAAEAWDAMALRLRRAQEQREVNDAAKHSPAG